MPDRWITTDYEALVEACIRLVLRPGDGAVDVGAHRGRHLRPMLEAVGPSGSVLAIEPLPDCVAELAGELGDHPALILVAGAVGWHREQVELVVAIDRPEESSLRARTKYSGPTALRTLTVEAYPLDELLAPMARIDLVKVDVEGAEGIALGSAVDVLRAHQPVVTIEHGPGIADFGGSTAELFALLEGLGDVLFTIDGERVGSAAHMEELAAQGLLWDYVAVPAGHPLVDSLPEALAHEVAVWAEVDTAIAAAYWSVLGRPPDTVGLGVFRPVCREHGIEAVRQVLRDSEEGRALGSDDG